MNGFRFLSNDAKIMHRPLFTSVALLAAVAAHAQYNIVTMTTPGTDATYVLDVNDSGKWTGYTVTANPNSPVGYTTRGVTGNADGSGIAAFDRAGYYSVGMSGINANGDTSGISIDANFAGGGVTRTASGTFTDVNPFGTGITSVYSEALDLNSQGTVVGFYDETQPTLDELNTGSISHGFLLKDGAYAKIDHPGGHGTQLYSVNDSGLVTGRYLDANEKSHGFLYHSDTGAFEEFGIPGFDSFEFDGLNNDGDFTAVGYADTPLGRVPFSFIHTGGTFVPFAVPGALATVAYGLNNGGQVAGVYVTADPTGALVYNGFVASPVPEPASLVALSLGIGALLRRRRR